MAKVMKVRWDPETDQPVAYYEEEKSPQEIEAERKAFADNASARRVSDAMAPGQETMRSAADWYRSNPMAYPLALGQYLGGAADAGIGWLTAQAANSGLNPFVETPTERDRFQRELKQFADVSSLVSGMNVSPASVMPKVSVSKSAASSGKPFMDVGRLESEPGLTLWQGSPANFAAELKVKMPDGSEQYLVGTPTEYPTVPSGATVIGEYPYGRQRREFNLTGEGHAAFGSGHYNAERKGIGESYRETLSTPKTYIDGRESDFHDRSSFISNKIFEARNKKIEDEFRKLFPDAPPGKDWQRYAVSSDERKKAFNKIHDDVFNEFDKIMPEKGIDVNISLSDALQPVKNLIPKFSYPSFERSIDNMSMFRKKTPHNENIAKLQGYKNVAHMNAATAYEETKKAISDAILIGKNIGKKNIRETVGGHLYESVLPERYLDSFVDQDLPFSQQPKIVQDAFIERFGKPIPDNVNMTEILRGKDPFESGVNLKKRNSDSRELADYLFSKGIPGSRFYDAASRDPTKADRTRNYVIFDDDILKIINKYKEGGIASLL